MNVTGFTFVRKVGTDYEPDPKGTHIKVGIDQGGPEYPQFRIYIMDLETDEVAVADNALWTEAIRLTPGSFRDSVVSIIKDFIKENQ